MFVLDISMLGWFIDDWCQIDPWSPSTLFLLWAWLAWQSRLILYSKEQCNTNVYTYYSAVTRLLWNRGIYVLVFILKKHKVSVWITNPSKALFLLYKSQGHQIHSSVSIILLFSAAYNRMQALQNDGSNADKSNQNYSRWQIGGVGTLSALCFKNICLYSVWDVWKST